MLALIALLTVNPSGLSELTLDVPLYLGADIDQEVLDIANKNAERLAKLLTAAVRIH